MMATIKVSEIRAKFPMYQDLSDDQLISGIRSKFYSDIPIGKFASMVEYDTQREALAREQIGSMGGIDKARAGFGKAVSDIGTGIGQMLGVVDQQDVDSAKRRDAPLMRTGAGMAGNIAGNVSMAIPTAFIPGAATLPGAAAVGAGMGMLQPVASDESRLANTAIGGFAGAGGVVAGRALGAGYQGAKALAEPFTQGGRERIAGRMIQRFADDPSRIASATSTPTITGARPTIAEQTGDIGLARLQDSLRAADPQFNNAIAGRLAENNAARVNALRGLTGEDGARDAAISARESVARQRYGDAFANNVAVTPSQLKAQVNLLKSDRIAKLLEAPAIKEAVQAARTNAANAGRSMDNPAGSIEGMHQVKLALDDMIKDPATAAQAARVSGLRTARDKLVGVIETLSPEYRGARQSYAAMSKPVNAFDIGEEVFKRATSNTSDLAGNPRMQANALLGMLKDEPALIRRATGRSGNNLSDIMEPDQLAMLRAVAGETGRAAAVASAGNGPGSATAQRMASQNVLRQIIGPTGLPESWAENALANTIVGKPLNLIYGGIAEPRIQQELAKAILDPSQAAAVLQAARQQGVILPPTTMRRLLEQAGRSAAPAASIPGQR
jgi:outer membrane murein-binding lipoprotein Lpp